MVYNCENKDHYYRDKMGSRDKKYWLSINTPLWVALLVISFVAFFPAFVALMILWALGRIEVA